MKQIWNLQPDTACLSQSNQPVCLTASHVPNHPSGAMVIQDGKLLLLQQLHDPRQPAGTQTSTKDDIYTFLAMPRHNMTKKE